MVLAEAIFQMFSAHCPTYQFCAKDAPCIIPPRFDSMKEGAGKPRSAQSERAYEDDTSEYLRRRTGETDTSVKIISIPLRLRTVGDPKCARSYS